MKDQSAAHYTMSPLELSITHISFTISAGILTVPRALVYILESSFGWISVITCGVIVCLYIWLIFLLQKKLGNEGLFDYLKRIGRLKWAGKLFSLLFFLYFLAFFCIEGRILARVVQIYLLDQTPAEVIFLFMVLATTYACSKGVEGIVHISLMYFPFVLSVLAIVVLLNIGNFQVNELRPFVAGDVMESFNILRMFYFFLGFEIFFFFQKYVNPVEADGRKQKKLKPLRTYILGVGSIVFIYGMIVVFSYGVLSVEATKVMPFPTVELSKEVEVLEGLIERVEPLIIVMWIMTIFNTMAILHFLAADTFHAQWLPGKNANTIAFTFGLLSFMFAFYPESLTETLYMSEWIGYGGWIVVTLFLALGFLTIRKNSRSTRGTPADTKPGGEVSG
ncbi:GerAB/ArcD/ProY family transporter [Alteribacter natronophilus]|uniref:GerAB/ArcD/ProY family transporter n=1 Tax=Alteribacter natronophilus TaxID=2583810 RepID=UPI00110D3B3F|nr:GerAB/ArcD/ProY family transporter [Alteribacter natronophilus]TMW73995.1 hypothetical protein FGB90_06930 [Alteribacter natronophilus]